MDPLSVAGIAIAVATAVLQSVKALSELVDSVENAPKEISGLTRDLHAFQAVVASLQAALEDDEIKNTVIRDTTLGKLVGNLKSPLSNCSTTMEELKDQILLYVRRSNNGHIYKFTKRGTAKWAALGGRKEVNQIADRLMRNKMTLDNSMSVICTFCNVQARGASHGLIIDDRPGSGDTDAGFAMRRYLEVLCTAGSPPSSPAIDPMSVAENRSNHSLKTSHSTPDPQEWFQAAHVGNAATINALCNAGMNIECMDLNGKIALHIACQYGKEGVVLLLLHRKADYHAKQDLRRRKEERKLQGRTPLHWAAAEGCLIIISMLLDWGADPTMASTTLRRPLQEAIMRGHTSCAKLLVERGAPVNAQDEEGFGALHETAYYGRYDVAKMLVEDKADLELMTYSSKGRLSRRTPLLIAAHLGFIEIVELLLDQGANIHARNSSGNMAIHLGAWFGHTSIVRTLLDAGADIGAQDYRYDETPLHKAAAKGYISIVRLLLERGARLDPINFLGRDVLRHAKMHQAGNDATIRVLSDHVAMLASSTVVSGQVATLTSRKGRPVGERTDQCGGPRPDVVGAPVPQDELSLRAAASSSPISSLEGVNENYVDQGALAHVLAGQHILAMSENPVGTSPGVQLGPRKQKQDRQANSRQLEADKELESYERDVFHRYFEDKEQLPAPLFGNFLAGSVSLDVTPQIHIRTGAQSNGRNSQAATD